MALSRKDKEQLVAWDAFVVNQYRATPVDLNETATDKLKRIARLEANDEEWFKEYFPNFYTSEPAPFHKKATKRVMTNAEWYEVRSWARDLSKSGRTMMEVIKLTMTGKKKTVILTSATYDDAERLLKPYKTILEVNDRLKNDYGVQEALSGWSEGDFTTKKGVSFRAVGAGQSPRGTRNDAARPDLILIDDFDTDVDCNNPDTIEKKYSWLETALIPTRSISVPLLIIACGNIIAKYCCITEMAKKANIHDIVNIRDKNGVSTWPQRNTEALIDLAFRTMTTSAIQKEYFNNPIRVGKLFKKVHWAKCPPLRACEHVLVYSDPATSNKDNKSSSRKFTGVIGYRQGNFYLYKVWLDNMTQQTFVTNLYHAHDWVKSKKVDTFKTWIENNSLQDPFWEQVLKPLVKTVGKLLNKFPIFMSLDKRKKDDKYTRIEGTLEPKHKQGCLYFNEDEKDNPHMQRMAEEFLGVAPNSKMMDGPDGLEGGVWIIENISSKENSEYVVGHINNRKY
ncbi:hypothetical protein [Flavobacterium degerlachei]|jgi:hypothetical protein|uniref:Terminase-like family protein n=1 Tax=Flavobacterium degerlachei TaxID=229203 RepID=A0A1H2Z281_9FLAO|nr:hypothetical protein [Flavobacterium degerlachei]SDX11441.1 hypothetical protein SAMN05444338_10761 [Flavobacterium degerlachei]